MLTGSGGGGVGVCFVDPSPGGYIIEINDICKCEEANDNFAERGRRYLKRLSLGLLQVMLS